MLMKELGVIHSVSAGLSGPAGNVAELAGGLELVVAKLVRDAVAAAEEWAAARAPHFPKERPAPSLHPRTWPKTRPKANGRAMSLIRDSTSRRSRWKRLCSSLGMRRFR